MKRNLLALFLFIGCLDLQAGRSSRRTALGKASLIGALLIGSSSAQPGWTFPLNGVPAAKVVQESLNNNSSKRGLPVTALVPNASVCALFDLDPQNEKICYELFENPFKDLLQGLSFEVILDNNQKELAYCVVDTDNPTEKDFVYCCDPKNLQILNDVLGGRTELRIASEKHSKNGVNDLQSLYEEFADELSQQSPNNRLTDLEKVLLKHLEEKKDLGKK